MSMKFETIAKRNSLYHKKKKGPVTMRWQLWVLAKKTRWRTRVAALGLCLLMIFYVVHQFQRPVSRIEANNIISKTRHLENEVDLHVEIPNLGHIGGAEGHTHLHTKHRTTITLGCAVTSRGIAKLSVDNMIYRFPFFRTLLVSFCKTATGGYDYSFYLTFDDTDSFFIIRDNLVLFNKHFRQRVNNLCPRESNYSLHLVQCSHSNHPTWAQNDAMMEAYLDNSDYYYRVNDDTLFRSPDWTEMFIDILSNYQPPLVGVVGPTHTGGKVNFMTFDFVHRTHLEIFGFYYPRVFTDWWADDWINQIYGKERCIKTPGVRVAHTMETGQRYTVRKDMHDILQLQLQRDRKVLARYLKAREDPNFGHRNSGRVISMSLWGYQPRYTFGLIRNAQLAPVIFPGWTIRVYVEKPHDNGRTYYPKIPERIMDKLKNLGCQIVQVDTTKDQMPPEMWRFLVADDTSVEYFIVRDADSHLTPRDFAVVRDWIKSDSAFHCIRDHRNHSGISVSNGLWGGKPKSLQHTLGTSWRELIKNNSAHDLKVLMNNFIWNKVKNVAYCHDSLTCREWPSSHPFPVTRQGNEFIGQKFDGFGNPDSDQFWNKSKADVRCTLPDTVKTITKRALPVTLEFKKVNRVVKDVSHQNKTVTKNEKKDLSKIIIWTVGYDSTVALDLKYIMQSPNVIFANGSLVLNCKNQKECDTRKSSQSGMTDTVEKQSKKGVFHLDNITHFLCINPLTMCEKYVTYGKPIIMYVTNRYEKDRHSINQWEKWNKAMDKLIDDPSNQVIANNVYDANYVNYFLGYKPLVIQSQCSYLHERYNPINDSFLLHPIANIEFENNFLTSLTKIILSRNLSLHILPLRTWQTDYKQGQVAAFKGIIYVPNQVSFFSFCEQYRMNIPLFFPALDLLITWHMRHKVVSQRTLNQLRLLGGLEPNKSPIDGFGWMDPNDETNSTVISYWLTMSDFYQWPHVIYFNSPDDLVDKLMTTNLTEISSRMRMHNRWVTRDIKKKWSDIIGASNETKTYETKEFGVIKSS